MVNKKLLVTSLVILMGATGFTVASPVCNAVIRSDDQVRWDMSTIKVSKACEKFTLTLVHEGSLNKEIMGHNWVLTKQEDSAEVAKAVIFEKETDYINDDPRIIAHSQLISGGQRTSVTFDVTQLEQGQQYSYFCSYPEHINLMHGSLQLVD